MTQGYCAGERLFTTRDVKRNFTCLAPLLVRSPGFHGSHKPLSALASAVDSSNIEASTPGNYLGWLNQEGQDDRPCEGGVHQQDATG